MFRFLAEMFLLGVKNLHLHKLRSLLTALGIIFGVAAVIIMVSIGEGTKQAALEQLRQLGAKNIIVRSLRPPESSDSSSKTTRILEYGVKRADLRRLQDIQDTLRGSGKGIRYIVPLRDTEQRVVRGDLRVPANAIGTTPDVFDVINLHLDRGRYFNWVDFNGSSPVCVLGDSAAKQLFPYQDPLGSHVLVGDSYNGSVILEVVGVLEPTGLRAEGAAMINRNLDMDVYFPLSLAASVFKDQIYKRTAGSREQKIIELTEVWLQTENVEDVEHLASVAENIVSSTHPPPPDYEVKAPIQILRAAEAQTRMFNFIMVGIASFALVVGGIGIMNIMLANVTERTREIGIRRALGAKRRHITLQFLIECTVISLSGGLIGIALGTGVSKALPVVVAMWSEQSYRTVITSWSVLGSFLVSGMIGIGFGLYPAVMAARMNPIEALRHE